MTINKGDDALYSQNDAPRRTRMSRRSKAITVTLLILCLLPLAYLFWDYSPFVDILRQMGFLSSSTTTTIPPQPEFSATGGDNDQEHIKKTFKLRHILHHNTRENPSDHGRLDITNDFIIGEDDEYSSNPVEYSSTVEHKCHESYKKIRRMAVRDPDTMEAYLAQAATRYRPSTLAIDWVDELISIPNITDRDTMIALANMAANAYVELPHTGNWINVTDPWNTSQHFGWMRDGVRGHVFANDANDTIVISLKGTSSAIFDSGGDTAPNDKINDNLLFSCCCARISYLWNTVCDCYTGESYTCNQTCLERQIYREDRYYKAALNVYRNVSSLYPSADIWMIGHSLGGSLSALVGRTFGVPAVTFEAPPERLAAERLHLPMAPGVPIWEDYIYHVGHTADPIFMGICNGAGSSCWIGGYAMETQCHSGLHCVYDVVNDRGWHVSLVNHRIHTVIDEVLTQYNTTPVCKEPPPCKDCFDWKFIDDEAPSTTSKTTAKSTSTIETSTSSSRTTTRPSKPTSTSDRPQKCLKRTWYGRCIEYGPVNPTSTVAATKTTSTTSTVSTTSTTDKPTQTTCEPGEDEKCMKRTWYGWCIKYGCI